MVVAIFGPLRNYYIGFGLLLQTAALVAFNPAMAQTRIVDALKEQYPYEARDMQATEMLQDFSRYTDIPVLSDDVRGKASVDNGSGTASDFLDDVARQTASIWWSDGVAIHFEPRQSVRRDIVAADGVTFDELERMVDLIGLTTSRYHPSATPDGELFIVTGPAGYVDAVIGVINQIKAVMVEPEAPEPEAPEPEPEVRLPQVYRGGPIFDASPNNRQEPAPGSQLQQ